MTNPTWNRAAMFKEARRLGFARTLLTRSGGAVMWEYTKEVNGRRIIIQFRDNGLHRATHYLNGRMSTYPTEFQTIDGLWRAVRNEQFRRDHPPAEYPAPSLPPVELRPAVLRFADAMERTLRLHDRDKGSRGWRRMPYPQLLELATEQFADLIATSKSDRPTLGHDAVNLANICMMIFDVGLVEAVIKRLPARATSDRGAAT